MPGVTDPIHETGRVSITSGMANAMVRYGAARQCPECQFACPKYPGRYPHKCPRCGEALCSTTSESLDEAMGAGEAIRKLSRSFLKVKDDVFLLPEGSTTRRELVRLLSFAQNQMKRLRQRIKRGIVVELLRAVSGMIPMLKQVNIDISALTEPAKALSAVLSGLGEGSLSPRHWAMLLELSETSHIDGLSLALDDAITERFVENFTEREFHILCGGLCESGEARALWGKVTRFFSPGAKAAKAVAGAVTRTASRAKKYVKKRAKNFAANRKQRKAQADQPKRESNMEAMPVVCVSNTHRIQNLIEAGQVSFSNYMNDGACSHLVTVRFESLDDVGGPDGLRMMLEGPTQDGHYYRVEGVDEPVLVFKFDESTSRMRVFASDDPSRYLRFDPRDSIVDEDHEATFDSHESSSLEEGVLQRVAEAAADALRKKLSKLKGVMGYLRLFKQVFDDAQRATGKSAPMTTGMRMAMTLDADISGAMSGVRESWEPWDSTELDEAQLDESMGFTAVVGLILGVMGGIPLLLGALARATKWLGLDRAHTALSRAAHVAHEIESSAIDWAIPAELSHTVYTMLYSRGFRMHAVPGLSRVRHLEGDGPLTVDTWMSDREVQATFESGMYRIILVYFAFSGLMVLLHAPLSALFAAEATATGVKAVEIGQGAKVASRIAQAVRAAESVDPRSVRMVVIEDRGVSEDADAASFSGVQFFVTENDAGNTASKLGLNLVPSLRSVGGERLWVLVHEATGYALGRGESKRLNEFFGPNGPRAVDRAHDRVAGSFEEDARSSAKRPRKPGEGRTQIMGPVRMHVGKNQDRKPNKDVSRALQNKRNANSPGAGRARIRGLKKWHRGPDGKRFHDALNRYNQQNNEAAAEHDAALRTQILDVKDRIARYSAGGTRQIGTPIVSEEFGTQRPNSSGGTEQMTAVGSAQIENPTPDDFLEGILRRLIVTQNMDVLQDVEFDDETGSVYMFFDPVLMPDEVYEIMSAIKQERGDMQLIASPNMSLPGESVESDWWVFYLPGINDSGMPNPSIYSREPDQHGTKVQAVVMAPPNTPEAVAQGIDVGAMMQSAGS